MRHNTLINIHHYIWHRTHSHEYRRDLTKTIMAKEWSSWFRLYRKGKTTRKDATEEMRIAKCVDSRYWRRNVIWRSKCPTCSHTMTGLTTVKVSCPQIRSHLGDPPPHLGERSKGYWRTTAHSPEYERPQWFPLRLRPDPSTICECIRSGKRSHTCWQVRLEEVGFVAARFTVHDSIRFR